MKTLRDFFLRFPDEKSCLEHFISERLSNGLHCKNCGGSDYLWITQQQVFKCRKCTSKISYKSGTVMHKSKLPLLDWYTAMFLMTATKKSFSSHEMRRQLGRKRYEPVFRMMHKIRSVMGQHEEILLLSDEIELDDAFFETVNRKTKDQLRKRGRGSQKQTSVLVMAESKEMPSHRNYRKSYSCKHFKMRVLSTVNRHLVNQAIEQSVHYNTNIISDGLPAFNEVINKVREHNQLVIPPKEQGELLPWVHTAISNAKRLLLGVYHRIDEDYLQCYLDEFTFKLNKRFALDKFEPILNAALTFRWNQFCLG